MNESTANPPPTAELKGSLQFSLRSLFHLCCFVSALSLAAEGAMSGSPGKIILPLMVLGALYTLIVAFRLRRTIARFPWDSASFFFNWLFLVLYASLLAAYVHSLKGPSWYSLTIVKGMAIGLTPIAFFATYRTARIYWRAKVEPDDDYC